MSELFIIIALILFNGILAMSEIALISARKSFLTNEMKKGSKSASIALKLANDPDKFLSTIQIGITIIGILTGIYSGNVLAQDFAVFLGTLGFSTSATHTLAQTIIVIVVTYFTLIFGELVPKRIGMSVAEATVKIVARPMYLLSKLASPFVWLLAQSTSVVFNMLGLKSEQGKVTEDEIKSMIEEGTKGGVVQEVEQDIVERVFLLGDLRIKSLMTHRSDLIFIDVNMTKEEIKNIIESSIYNVYPIINKNTDNVVGVITIKKLLFQFDNHDFALNSVMQTPIYFHENTSVYKALARMKEERITYALVCDEFGSCQGLISLKDILEGLVGNIEDSNSEPAIIKRNDVNEWLVDGQCSLYEFLCYFEKESLFISNNDFNTVGGLILNLLERIPKSGCITDWKCFRFEVADMDGARIDKVLVTLKS